MRQTLKLHNRLHRALTMQPVTTGVPWPRGAVAEVDKLSLRDEKGQPLQAGFTCLNRWPDGTVQWSLVDLGLDFAPTSNRHVTVLAEPRKQYLLHVPASAAPVIDNAMQTTSSLNIIDYW